MKNTIKILYLVFTTCFGTFINAQTSPPIYENTGTPFYDQSVQFADSLIQPNRSDRQTGSYWISNENGTGGIVPKDIIYIEELDRIYVYGKRNILVVDASTNQIITTIENISIFSQFYPSIERTEFLKYNHFAYYHNSGNGKLFCVLENSNIAVINTTTNTVDHIIEPWEYCGYFGIKNCFLKFDSQLNRIYYAISTNDLNELHVWDADDYSRKGYLDFDDPGIKNNIRSFEISSSAYELYVGVEEHFKKVSFSPLVNIEEGANATFTTIGTYSNAVAGHMINLEDENKLFCFPTGISPQQTANYFVLNTQNGNISQYTSPGSVTALCFDGNDKLFVAYKSETPNFNIDLRSIDIDDHTYGPDVNTNDASADGTGYTIDMGIIDDKLLITKIDEVTLYNPSTGVVSNANYRIDENYYFVRAAIAGSATGNDKAFVINTWGTEIDIFDQTGQVVPSIDIGGIAYYACENHFYDKIYFYNKHLQGHGKVYVFDKQTYEWNIITIPGSISDIEIDPTTNNALVSTYDDSKYLKVVQDDVLLSSGNWLLLDHNYISEMFVSPANKLYCISGKKSGANDNGIEIGQLSSGTYTNINFKAYSTTNDLSGCFAINRELEPSQDPLYVYAIITDNNSGNNNKLVKIDDADANAIVNELTVIVEKPRKIVYNNAADKMYISHADVNHTVSVLECRTDAIIATLSFENSVLDIASNSLSNFIYVLHATDPGPDMRISKISGTTISNNPIDGLYSQSSSLKFNTENSMLYVHVPFTEEGCADGDGGVYEIFDNGAGNHNIVYINNGHANRGYYQQGSIVPLNHDIIIDNDERILYYAGGGHSCINTMELKSFFQLRLNYPYTWLSVPRHERTTSADLTPTEDVFSQSNISNGYTSLDLSYNNIGQGAPAFQDNIVYAKWNPTDLWDYEHNIMLNIHSTRGYMLEITQDDPPYELYLDMQGEVQDPTTTFDLYCKNNNWVGYFLYEEQNIFDALGNYESDIFHIQHQGWACYKTNHPITPDCNSKSTRANDDPKWVCTNTPKIKYGDMVILMPDHDVYSFNWDRSIYNPGNFARPGSEYYTVDEKAAYTTLVIELDTTVSNPEEIGAFVNDTCIGACKVFENDSVVIMQAYLGDQPGDSVVFEHYSSSSKSTMKKIIDDYYITDQATGKKTRGKLVTGKGLSFQLISFRDEKNATNNEDTDLTMHTNFVLYPNPTKNNVTIVFDLSEVANVSIDVFDYLGRRVSKVPETLRLKGRHNIDFKASGTTGVEPKPGIYLVRLNINNRSFTQKLLIK